MQKKLDIKFILFDKKIELKKQKIVIILLNGLYGISFSTIRKILIKFGIYETTLLCNINTSVILILLNFFNKYALSKEKVEFIEDYFLLAFHKLKTYKSSRQSMGLPVRGQRTHTNSKRSRSLKFQLRLLQLIALNIDF